jgi:adenylate kinase family enzyme
MNSPSTFPYRRICVVGTTGSGKTRLASELARRLHIPHLELDAHHWQPNWKEADRETTRRSIEQITSADAWVSDGNYGFLRDILWKRAEAIIWLDYPLLLILWRLWWRTWKRVITKERLWGTNIERLGAQFFSKDSLFLWALKTHKKRYRDYTTIPSLPEYAHLEIFRFKSPGEMETWLGSIPGMTSGG